MSCRRKRSSQAGQPPAGRVEHGQLIGQAVAVREPPGEAGGAGTDDEHVVQRSTATAEPADRCGQQQRRWPLPPSSRAASGTPCSRAIVRAVTRQGSSALARTSAASSCEVVQRGHGPGLGQQEQPVLADRGDDDRQGGLRGEPQRHQQRVEGPPGGVEDAGRGQQRRDDRRWRGRSAAPGASRGTGSSPPPAGRRASGARRGTRAPAAAPRSSCAGSTPRDRATRRAWTSAPTEQDGEVGPDEAGTSGRGQDPERRRELVAAGRTEADRGDGRVAGAGRAGAGGDDRRHVAAVAGDDAHQVTPGQPEGAHQRVHHGRRRSSRPLARATPSRAASARTTGNAQTSSSGPIVSNP
jgi:hypothetical protein